jgi:phage tail sheath protein FI
LYGAFDDTITEAKTAGFSLSGADVESEHVAYFYPWVYIPTAVAGINRLIPPVGYAAAKRAVAHIQTGAHQPGAGLISVARYVNGVATDIDKTNGDALDDAYINAIRLINNTVRIYGARSMSSDVDNFRYITAQDVVNQVVVEANRSLEDLLFGVIDGRNTIFASVESKLFAILEPLRVNGALFEAFNATGKRVDFGYTVKCDSTINPTSQLATGLVKARVGMRVSSVGDKIEVEIIKSNLTKSVV